MKTKEKFAWFSESTHLVFLSHLNKLTQANIAIWIPKLSWVETPNFWFSSPMPTLKMGSKKSRPATTFYVSRFNIQDTSVLFT